VISTAATSRVSGGGAIASLGDEVRRIKIDDVAKTNTATMRSERF
jgi:hypothetical protein